MNRSRKNPKSHKGLAGKQIVLAVSGSIAAYRSCDLVRDLKSEGAEVTVLMTEAAKKFVSPLTFHALSGRPVHSDPFSEHEDWNVLHTKLADEAHLILICPATADLIARLAHGFASDLVTSAVLASRAPVMVVPAMNDNMYEHPMTQENMAKLKRIGYRFVSPIEGDLVCGRVGVGHIADTEAIVSAVQHLLNA